MQVEDSQATVRRWLVEASIPGAAYHRLQVAQASGLVLTSSGENITVPLQRCVFCSIPSIPFWPRFEAWCERHALFA